MKLPSFPEGIMVAAIASSSGSALLCSLALIGFSQHSARLVLALLAGGYLLYLLLRAEAARGRLLASTLWLLSALSLSSLPVSGLTYLSVHILLLSLLRSLFFHARPLAALADLLLSLLSVCIAVWVYVWTDSSFLSLWCFFLLQAGFIAIPGTSTANADQPEAGQSFTRARSTAEAALARLSRTTL